MAITRPTGSPSRVAQIPEIDGDVLNNLIEARGTRVIWERAAGCPCLLNAVTEQPDPECTRCNGLGFFHFGAAQAAQDNPYIGHLTQLQQAIRDTNNGAVIRALVQQIKGDDSNSTDRGPWLTGELSATVRPENKLGYYDRLTLIDSVITYNEIKTLPEVIAAGPYVQKLRYRALRVNAVFTVTTRYDEGDAFEVTPAGNLRWRNGQAPAGQRLVVHYETHPAFLVMDRPHTMRQSATYRKPRQARTTALGDPQELPLRARLLLEFLQDKPAEEV